MKGPQKYPKSLYLTFRLSTRYKLRICKPLLPLKITLFIFFGAGSSLIPFLIVLYKQRGISVTQISTMTMCAPLMQYCGTLLSGVVADKTGRAKPVVVVNMLITVVTIMAITLLPNITDSCQNLVLSSELMDGQCGTVHNPLELSNTEFKPSKKTIDSGGIEHNHLELANAEFRSSYLPADNSNIDHNPELHTEFKSSYQSVVKSGIRYNLLKISGTELMSSNESVGSSVVVSHPLQQLSTTTVDDFDVLRDKKIRVPICEASKCFKPSVTPSKQHDKKTFYLTNVKCGSISTMGSQKSSSWLPVHSFDSFVQLMCEVNQSAKCDLTLSFQPVFCNQPTAVSPYYNTVFIAHFALFVIFYTGFTSSYNSLDVSMVFLAEKYDSSVGHEIAFGYLGSVMISPFGAIIADATSAHGERNCISVLYFYVALTFLTFLVLYKVPIFAKPPGEKILSNGLKLLRNPHILVFFSLLLFLGTCYNLQGFFKIYMLDDLHATSFLIAIVTNINNLYGFPVLLTSNRWLKKVGTQMVLIASLLCHGFNFVGYSFLQNPWYSLLCEANTVVFHLALWVAVIEFSNRLAPEGFAATLISTCGGVHWTMGKATSGFVGTIALERFGTRTTFRFFAVLCWCTAMVYCIYVYFTRASIYESRENSEKSKELNMTSPIEEQFKSKFSLCETESDRQVLLKASESTDEE